MRTSTADPLRRRPTRMAGLAAGVRVDPVAAGSMRMMASDQIWYLMQQGVLRHLGTFVWRDVRRAAVDTQSYLSQESVTRPAGFPTTLRDRPAQSGTVRAEVGCLVRERRWPGTSGPGAGSARCAARSSWHVQTVGSTL